LHYIKSVSASPHAGIEIKYMFSDFFVKLSKNNYFNCKKHWEVFEVFNEKIAKFVFIETILRKYFFTKEVEILLYFNNSNYKALKYQIILKFRILRYVGQFIKQDFN
jgi:hypothetical protein